MEEVFRSHEAGGTRAWRTLMRSHLNYEGTEDVPTMQTVLAMTSRGVSESTLEIGQIGSAAEIGIDGEMWES
jgi:hypothetical protein